MRIQHNIAAMNSYRNYTNNTGALSKNLEKLSSGYKINRAGDDAAGLAISEKMRAQISGLKQAQSNVKDGISLVKTAEGALQEVQDMMNRMVTLATQSANGTYDNDVDRANLQKEVEALKTEIDRIADSSNFNGTKLLDGSLGGASNGAGALTGAKIVTFKPATTGVLSGDDLSGGITFSKETLTIDGVEVEVDWSKLSAEDQNFLKKDWTGASLTETKQAAEILQNTINAAIDKTNAENGTSVEHITVKTSSTANQFEFISGLNDSVKSGIEATQAGFLGVFTGASADIAAQATLKLTPDAADINGKKFDMFLNGESVEMSVTGLVNTAANDGSAIATALQTGINTAITAYCGAKGLTGSEITDLQANVKVTFNDQGHLEIINNTGMSLSFADKKGEKAAELLGISNSAGTTSTGGLQLQIGDTADSFNQIKVSIQDMHVNSLGLGGLDISKQTGAAAAIEKIKTALNTVSSTRGDLGAIQNRLEHTTKNLQVMTENIQDAESTIRDVDIADEMTTYTKNNILLQSAQAMLAQANQMPQGVLQLLQ